MDVTSQCYHKTRSMVRVTILKKVAVTNASSVRIVMSVTIETVDVETCITMSKV